MTQKPQDINLFGVGQIVTVPGIEGYEKIEITRISDSGVTVNGKCGKDVVLSGRTPAILWVEEIKEEILNKQSNEPIKKSNEQSNKLNSIMTTENKTNDPLLYKNEAVVEINSNRARRGSIKAKMGAIQIPDGVFTVKQLAEMNGIPSGYANKWCKENAKPAGSAAKQNGKRGRVAALFTV